jgi:hypothetical protein
MNQEEMKSAWLAFGDKLLNVCEAVFQQANFADQDKQFSDTKVVAVALLCRTVNNYAGARLMIENDFIVEARTLVRCCYENLFWIGGLTGKGTDFIKQMIDDDTASRLKRGSELLEWAKEQRSSVGFEGTLTAFLDDLKKNNSNPSIISHKGAADAGGLRDGYIVYRVLSTDAAHPSATSLSRHMQDSDDSVSPERTFLGTPLVQIDEVDETLEFACSALLAVCVGANQLLGGTQAGKSLHELFDEFKKLSALNKAFK